MGKIKKADEDQTIKEKEIWNRANELVFDTDRYGPGSLMTQADKVNSSRAIMLNHHMTQFVSIKDPEMPLVPTGFEKVLGGYSSMNEQLDANYEIVAKFVKNQYNYILIGFDKKNRVYTAWKRQG